MEIESKDFKVLMRILKKISLATDIQSVFLETTHKTEIVKNKDFLKATRRNNQPEYNKCKAVLKSKGKAQCLTHKTINFYKKCV